MEKYYLRNKDQNYYGNAPIWYGKKGRGYTAYISGAEMFSKESAESFVEQDSSKWEMWPCEEINKRLHYVFDSQDFRRLGTNEPCGFYEYAPYTKLEE